MIFLYRLAFPLVAILASPYFFYRMLRRGGYGFKFYYRLGLFPHLPKKQKNSKRVWIQAVSVGELSSLSKVLKILTEDSNIEIVLTGTTSTGLLMADKRYANSLLSNGPFPLDWWLFSHLAWSRIKPDLIITVDSELWPEHFHQASRKAVPALVINARLSDRTYQRLSESPMARKLLLPEGLEILTTSERQASRWVEIGVQNKCVQVVGNLKVDAVPATNNGTLDAKELKLQFGFKEDSLVITGVST